MYYMQKLDERTQKLDGLRDKGKRNTPWTEKKSTTCTMKVRGLTR